jgi:hypothetical protein
MRIPWIWFASAIALIALGFTAGMVAVLWPGTTQDDKLTAAAAVLGGLIGALGTALAVYLTLASQREDEAQKVEGALRMEVAEFARLALAALVPCESVLVKRYKIPMRDLPALTEMPEAVVYKATADRVSRLPYGSLFVTFHARIAEAVQMATIYAVTARPVIHEGMGPTDPLVDDATAKNLANAWLDVCSIAQTILRKEAVAPGLADAAIASTLTAVGSALTRVGPMVAEPEAAATPDTAGRDAFKRS